MRQRKAVLAAACLGVIGFAGISRGQQVVINEFMYDDTKTSDPGDDREFIELYNSGLSAIDISGWTLSGRDIVGNTNPSTTLPGALGSNTTVLAPGAYYVIGNAGVLNLNHTVAANFLENDAETLELRNAGTLIDAVVYETNKGPSAATIGYGTLPADVLTQVNNGVASNSPGYWGNSQSVEVGTSPSASATVSIARYLDGRDTNVNGRDFGTRKATPGTSNLGTGSIITAYTPANVDALSVGSDAPGLQATFVGGVGQPYTAPSGAKVINPTVISTFNSNAIVASPHGGNVITVVDNSGGGNVAVGLDVFDGKGSFNIDAYLETADAPGTENESTMYGVMGNSGSLFNVPDPEGDIFVSTAPGSAGDGTGVGWLFQRFGARAKLYLVDAGDGGNSSPDISPNEWSILASYDLSNSASNWHQLAISVNPDGTGFALFDGQITNFTTAAGLTGEFYVGYREALAGSPGTPGSSTFRAPTFDISTSPIPEPTSLALLSLGGLFLRRRRS